MYTYLAMSMSFVRICFPNNITNLFNREINGIGMSCKSFWQLAFISKGLARGVRCPAKCELKSSHFALISDMNLLLWYIGGIQGISLPFNFFTRDQYFLGLRLLSDYLGDIFSKYFLLA